MNVMSGLKGVSDFFGLDIGTSAIRVVQLKGPGPIKNLDHYGHISMEGNLALSNSRMDQQRLAMAIKQLVRQAGISSPNVAVGLPSHKVFTTVIDLNRLSPDEMSKTIRYQAESFIPTALDDSKIDWAIIGDSPKEPGKVEVLLSSVTNEFVENRLDLLEGIGLNVVAFEPDSMALSRAIVPADMSAPQMVLDIGSKSTDLVVAMGGAPRLTRAIPVGSEAIVRSAMQNLAIDQKQAEQFVFKFGLSNDKLEGQIYNAIISIIDGLTGEIEKSIKFFQTRYTSAKIERITVTGGASTLPEFPLHIANKFGLSVEIGNAWRNISFPASMQNELLAVSYSFSVAAGLAEREG